MEIVWARHASEDYDFLGLETDAKVAERIKQLIASIQETPFTGMGKPEPLKYDFNGWWSRRITGEHRLLYRVEGDPPVLTIIQCRYHY
jgi:toxin YoeB